MSINLQEKIDEAYPKYYNIEVNISKEQWLDLLRDKDIFKESNIEHFKAIYSFDNHAATSKEVSEKLEKPSSHYVGITNGLNQRISKKLNLKNLPAKDGSETSVYWYISFLGKHVDDSRKGVFEWKLRPALANALKELYPNLDYPKPAIKKFNDVPLAVWLGTAILAYEIFSEHDKPTKELMFFTEKEVLASVQKLCEKNLQYSDLNNLFNSYNYIKEQSNKSIRLSYRDEFKGKKEQPELVSHWLVETKHGIKSVKEIKEFVDINYTILFNNIDFIGILDYLETYSKKSYVKPDKLKGTEKEKHVNMNKMGKRAVNELDKIAELCERKFGLVKTGRSKWLDGGGNEVREYLWRQLKFEEYDENPTSLSLFVDIKDGQARFKISVELHERESELKDYENHHRLLNKDINTEKDYLEYIISEKKSEKQIEGLKLSTKSIKEGIENGDYRKIELSRVISRSYIEFHDNASIIREMLHAVNTLMPYYKLALGTEEDTKVSYGRKFSMRKDKNMILYGPPGTGKTYNTITYSVAIIENKTLKMIQREDYFSVFERYNEYKVKGKIAFITFHQSYGYEEFIEGIKPIINHGENKSTSDIQYEYSSGLFKEFCDKAKISINQKDEVPYVFIIDEINRGNISKIFGELITLIEPSKRIGEAEETKANLPYTGDPFGVPKNVYIIGTMNTADRSIALMDTALRRRFKFKEMMPDENVLVELNIPEIEGINIPEMLKTMNDRIEYLYDREHMIGHAYFTPLAKNSSMENLTDIFLYSIIPLLQEYFYEDYYKIQLVLGDNSKESHNKFILDTDINVQNVFKGSSDIDLPEKKYTIQEDAFYKPESYKLIY